jgi:para-nitrobenzyl esterase
MLRRRASRTLIFAGLAIGAICAATSQQEQEVAQNARPMQEVRVQSGLVQGVADDGLVVYRGIPFATPPVGDLRWRAPQPTARWASTLDATAFKPACMQRGPTLPGMMEDYSEDCPYLNIWSPAKRADQKLP